MADKYQVTRCKSHTRTMRPQPGSHGKSVSKREEYCELAGMDGALVVQDGVIRGAVGAFPSYVLVEVKNKRLLDVAELPI